MRIYDKTAAVVVIVAILAMAAASIFGRDDKHNGDLDRLHAIDACAARGGKAVVSRDGWWCEMPGALP